MNMTLLVFYIPIQDLAGRGGGVGGCIFFLLIKRPGISKLLYDVGGGLWEI